MKRFLALIALVASTFLLLPVVVQSANKNPKVADASIDLAVPDSPAFAVLGLNPNDVERPSSPREFATSLLNGVDANGNFQTGIAIETAPYMVFHGKDTTLDEYQTNLYTRFLSRTLLSFATAKGATDEDKAERLAVGLRFTPWDEGDPRMDKYLLECLKKAVGDIEINKTDEIDGLMSKRNLLEKQRDLATDETLKKAFQSEIDRLNKDIDKLRNEGTAELNNKSKKAIEVCRGDKKYRSNLWNKSSWSFGITPTFTSTTGKTDDLKSSGIGLSTSVALGLGDSGQFILHTRYRNKEEVPDTDNKGKFFEQDSFRLGGRVRYGSPDLNFNAEGMYIIENRKNGQKNDKKFRYGVGAEYNAAKDLWLVFSIGSESGNNKGDKLFVLGNLKFALSPNPTIKF
ncbi:MAG: hypothetical protein WC855_06015 [Thermodesulfovibrionales bacterium]